MKYLLSTKHTLDNTLQWKQTFTGILWPSRKEMPIQIGKWYVWISFIKLTGWFNKIHPPFKSGFIHGLNSIYNLIDLHIGSTLQVKPLCSSSCWLSHCPDGCSTITNSTKLKLRLDLLRGMNSVHMFARFFVARNFFIITSSLDMLYLTQKYRSRMNLILQWYFSHLAIITSAGFHANPTNQVIRPH